MSTRPKRSLRTSTTSSSNEPENIEDIVTNCMERMITGLEMVEFYDRTVREVWLAQRKLIDKSIAQVLKESDWVTNAQKSRMEHPILPLSKRQLVEDESDEEDSSGEGPSSPAEKKPRVKKLSNSKAKEPERPRSVSPPKKETTPPPPLEPTLELKQELEEGEHEKSLSPVPPTLEEEVEKRESSEPPSTPMQLECHPLQPETTEEEEPAAEFENNLKSSE